MINKTTTTQQQILRQKLLNPNLNYFERLKIYKILGIKKFSNNKNKWVKY